MKYDIHGGNGQCNIVKFEDGNILKAWNKGVPFEEGVYQQAHNLLQMPFVIQVCLMPDAHVGMGSTVGSVISMRDAVIPATVGVDLGCGMRATRTSLMREDISDEQKLFHEISKAIPNGRTDNGGDRDRGRWGHVPDDVQKTWEKELRVEYEDICSKNNIHRGNKVTFEHLGTLGGGNHFLECCTDTDGQIWLMCHSGSRGVGARVGGHFMRRAKDLAKIWFIDLPNHDLAYLPKGIPEYKDYLQAVKWCQKFAFFNRKLMMSRMVQALATCARHKFVVEQSFDCHHNYIDWENHGKKNVLVVRKGAIRARTSDLGIIPGSMGQKSYIVRGKGNEEALSSSSHGAGRKMSRTKARKTISVQDHVNDTKGVICDKTEEVIDESPQAYKSIDNVIEAEKDLVEVQYTLKQFVCVKGKEGSKRGGKRRGK